MNASLPTGIPLAAAAALGGVAALDNTAAFQLMVGQPVLAGTVAGAIFGDPLLGLEAGLTLQLLWSGSSPLGAARFADAPVGGTTGGAVAAFLAGAAGVPRPLALAFGLLAGLVTAEAGWWTVSWMRRTNVHWIHRADRAALEGDAAAITRWNLAGAFLSFTRGFVATLLAITVGALVGGLVTGRAGAPSTLDAPGARFVPAVLALRFLGIGVLAGALFSRTGRSLLLLAAGAACALVAGPLLAR